MTPLVANGIRHYYSTFYDIANENILFENNIQIEISIYKHFR